MGYWVLLRLFELLTTIGATVVAHVVMKQAYDMSVCPASLLGLIPSRNKRFLGLGIDYSSHQIAGTFKLVGDLAPYFASCLIIAKGIKGHVSISLNLIYGALWCSRNRCWPKFLHAVEALRLMVIGWFCTEKALFSWTAFRWGCRFCVDSSQRLSASVVGEFISHVHRYQLPCTSQMHTPDQYSSQTVTWWHFSKHW